MDGISVLSEKDIFQVVSNEELINIGHYVIIFICVFVCCFLGSFIRDAIYASKNSLKIDFKSIFLYDIPCASVIAALSDIYSSKVHISGWAFISLFIGLWSREFVAILLNSRFVSAVVRFLFGSAVEKARTQLTDSEKESLKSVFESAIDNATDNKPKSNEDYSDKVGEFEWISIIE